ncbi:MAG: hypothetical protein GY913_23915 [Proteobacteria bacterium]|nr:hypothetical protein [Pseudomonadota bacterium]
MSVLLLALVTGSYAADGKKKGKNKKKKPEWTSAGFVQPQLGAVMLTANGGGALASDLGVSGGLQYRWTGKSKLSGQTYVDVSGQLGSSVLGADARIGSKLGPGMSGMSPQLGLEVFWNQAAWSGAQLSSSSGIAVPLSLQVRKDKLGAEVGVAPAWTMNPNRRTPSRAFGVPGFAHEMAYFAVVDMKRGKGVRIGLKYEAQVREVGTTHTAGLQLRRKLD